MTRSYTLPPTSMEVHLAILKRKAVFLQGFVFHLVGGRVLVARSATSIDAPQTIYGCPREKQNGSSVQLGSGQLSFGVNEENSVFPVVWLLAICSWCFWVLPA